MVIITVVGTLLVLAVIGGTVQLSRTVPAPRVVTSLPTTYTIPGSAPKMPWPAHGQAGIDVLGIGSLGSVGGSTPVPIASAAKIMTAYLILKDHPLADGADGPTITITEADVADYRNDVAHNKSSAAVAAGEKLTERQALEAVLIPSADNVARLLATWDAGSIDAFVTKMNATATTLGMTGSHYTDPSGLLDSTVSTAADQIRLAEVAITTPAFADIVAMKKVTLPVAGVVKNYNSLLGTNGIIGIKTGSTSAAGGCLVFAARKTIGGHEYTFVGAVLGQGLGGPFVDVLPKVMAASRKLVAAAQASVHQYKVVRAGQPLADFYSAYDRHTTVVAGGDVTVAGWPGLTYGLGTHLTPVHRAAAGASIGSVTASGHSATATTSALIADEIVPPTVTQRLTRF
jgi:D-alanyl-D-alanine carboxypeptidase (penicillin-binding protein 5/6)